MAPRYGRNGLVLLVWLGFTALVAAQPLGPDPVDRLKNALRDNGSDPVGRHRILQIRIGNLRSPTELRRAYSLPDWREQGTDPKLAAVDRANHAEIGARFLQAAREAILRAEPIQAAAALDDVAELARDLRIHNQPTVMLIPFTPQLIRLTASGPPVVQAAAARALGLVQPPPDVALPALGSLFQSKELATRLAAAEGLASLLRASLAQIAANDGAAQHPAVRQHVAETTAGVIKVLIVGLQDAHPEIRRRCAILSGEAAGALGRLTGEPINGNNGITSNNLSGLLGLASGLGELGLALGPCVRDRTPETRLAVLKAMEENAVARTSWIQAGAAQDPLLRGLKLAVAPLAESVADTDARIRRSAIDVLETMGPVSAPAAPALTRALGDADRFVRWSAVRALTAIGPKAISADAVAGVARLLQDADPDLRNLAEGALERLDPNGQWTATKMAADGSEPRRGILTSSVMPKILLALKVADADKRLAALERLRGLGPQAVPAVPLLREVLHDHNVRVQVAAAEVLGQLGVLAREAVPDLRMAASDGNADVRRAAGEALIKILR